ncbi:hypothetical protein P9112_008292 [Eukaryota sp. TZLM1-RC]
MPPTNTTVYYDTFRTSTSVGDFLTEVVEDFYENGTLSRDLCNSIYRQYDKSLQQVLNNSTHASVTLSGDILSSNYVDDVWVFFMDDVTLKGSGPPMRVGPLKIVALDGRPKDQIRRRGKRRSSQR